MPKNNSAQVPPDERKLTGIQATRLAKLARLEVRELADQSIAQLSKKLKWKIDPRLLFCEPICGKVVRHDPETDTDLPVPYATVHVMDTDCDLLGYFPHHWPWVWCYPLWCHREEIGSETTDECGRFCVWVPRFDIDWVVRWRLRIRCFHDVFVWPNLGDLLEHLKVIPPVGPWPPDPDPGPLFRDRGFTLDRIAAVAGPQTAKRLAIAEQAARLGQAQTADMRALLSRPAFTEPVPPPMSPELKEFHEVHALDGQKALTRFVRGTQARAYHFDPDRYIGPFPRWRCEVVIDRVLMPFLDVPDITFRVTQDVDGDGNEETVYDERLFDVRWDSGPIPDITLHAWPNALAVSCDTIPQVGPCGEPMIKYAGLMEATSAYIDAGGFGIRANPPHADGVVRASVFPPAAGADTPANAPFTGTVQLYGCNQLPNGKYYRLLYSFNDAPPVPFTNLSWHLWPGPIHVTPDADGWYSILDNPEDWFPASELLDWPTTQFPEGKYAITMQIGDVAKNPIFTTPAPIAFYVDNSATVPRFISLAWRVAGAADWTEFPSLVCPVVYRPHDHNGNPVDIEFRVQYEATMHHLLKVALVGSGCGAGAPVPTTASDRVPQAHWHTNNHDNSVSQTAEFTLAGSALQGAYGFTLYSYSRAFNPAGGDGSDPQANDWYVDTHSLNWNWASLPVAVVNE